MANQFIKPNKSVRKIRVRQKKKSLAKRYRDHDNSLNTISNHGALRRELAGMRNEIGIGSQIPYKAEMEKAFSRDFSNVTAYTNEKARNASEVLGAEAFTVGKDVFFAHTNPTRDTIAHELTHVVQHDFASGHRNNVLMSRNDPAEREAERVQHEITAGKVAPEISTTLPISAIATSWSPMVCLHPLGYYENVMAQYDPESEQLRLIVSHPAPGLIMHTGDPDIGAPEVAQAIGLVEPDGLENRRWLWNGSRWEIQFDVNVFSLAGRQELAIFFSPPVPKLTETQARTQQESQEQTTSAVGEVLRGFRVGFQRGIASAMLGAYPVFGQITPIMGLLGFAPTALAGSVSLGGESSVALVAVGVGATLAVRYTPVEETIETSAPETYAGRSLVADLEFVTGSVGGAISLSLLQGLLAGERRMGWIAVSTSIPGLSIGIWFAAGERLTTMRFGSVPYEIPSEIEITPAE